jgi:hypothetical protein
MITDMAAVLRAGIISVSEVRMRISEIEFHMARLVAAHQAFHQAADCGAYSLRVVPDDL